MHTRGRAVAILAAASLVLGLGTTATATGHGKTSLDVCIDGKYSAGVQVFARDGGKGERRVMCVDMTRSFQDSVYEESWGGVRQDRDLDKRNRKKPGRRDIWNGMARNIESLRLIVREAPQVTGDDWARCGVKVRLYGPHWDRPFYEAELSTTSKDVGPERQRFEIPKRYDDRATRLRLEFTCVEQRGLPRP